MKYLLGKEIAEKIKLDLQQKIALLDEKPKYAILLNEDDSSSVHYVLSQKKLATQLGIDLDVFSLKSDENEYILKIKELNNDSSYVGILITRPLFKNANEKKILSYLDPNKDIDAVNSTFFGKLLMNENYLFPPATSEAVMLMLEHYKINVDGKNVLVVGRSLSVGKPIALLLLNKNATVTIAHSHTKNLNEHLAKADIVIVSIGKAQYIDGKLLKDGAIVLDCGIHYLDSGIVGDVKVDEKLSMISKVPGGIGPITSILLMEHIYKCYMVNKHD